MSDCDRTERNEAMGKGKYTYRSSGVGIGEMYAVYAPKKSKRAKILKLADKTSNSRAIAASPPPDWSVKRRLEYVEWARRVSEGLTGASQWLEGEFEQAAKEAERSTVFHR
jgi:hypothetical protein